MLRSQRGVQIDERQGDPDDLGGEPDLAADGAGPGERPEAEEEREGCVVPFRARAALQFLEPPQEAMEESDVERAEREGEGDVVEAQALEGDERHHQQGGKRRERDVPAAILEHPVVQVRRLMREVQLAMEERLRLVDKVRGLRLPLEHRAARERVGEKSEEEEDQVDAMVGGPAAPGGSAHAFPGRPA